jgi:hypothetical protein
MRAASWAGLAVVVDVAISSAIADAAMNRRHPMTTLASLPERSIA